MADLRYDWRKLIAASTDLSARLGELQTSFKRELVRNVKLFVADVTQLRLDYESSGPMVPGLPPMEAVERLRKFQRLYEQRMHRFETYSAGEQLFGLTVTQYPELVKTGVELKLLERLYSLYLNVISTVNDFNELPWYDVGGSMDGMTAKISEFQHQSAKMPKKA